MDQVEEVLSEYESSARTVGDLQARIHGLISLTIQYTHQFGIPFEKRHAYRRQLLGVVAGDFSLTLDEARTKAREAYANQHGSGLPETWRNVGLTEPQFS